MFMTDHTSSSPSSPGRSVQLIGRCANLVTVSTRRREIHRGVRSLDMTWLRRHNSATTTIKLHLSLVRNNLPKDNVHQEPLRRANCVMPIQLNLTLIFIIATYSHHFSSFPVPNHITTAALPFVPSPSLSPSSEPD
jgi:hypothetical protein